MKELQKVIDAMKTIKDYCKSLPADGCCRCPFRSSCFGINPEDWDIEEAKNRGGVVDAGV